MPTVRRFVGFKYEINGRMLLKLRHKKIRLISLNEPHTVYPDRLLSGISMDMKLFGILPS